jgi:hypothetical protein
MKAKHWPSVLGLFLLPALYWAVDLLMHALPDPLFLFANIVLPVIVSFAAFRCFIWWPGRFHILMILVVAMITLITIWALGPTYMMVGSRLVWKPNIPTAFSFKEWIDLTRNFGLSTLDISTYDGTLPAPLLAAGGIIVAGFVYRARARRASKTSSPA